MKKLKSKIVIVSDLNTNEVFGCIMLDPHNSYTLKGKSFCKKHGKRVLSFTVIGDFIQKLDPIVITKKQRIVITYNSI